LNVNIEGREDEAALTDYDELGEEVLEEEIDIEDFELGDLSTAENLDEGLVADLFADDEGFDENLEDDEF
jgi:DNA-directed RNA polymerase subunit beta